MKKYLLMRQFLIFFVTMIVSSVVFSSCFIFKKKGNLPSGFIQTTEVGWSTIQIRGDVTFEKAFEEVLDVVAKRFEMDVISKEGAYARSQWSYRWGAIEGSSYRTRVTFKFSPDKTKVDLKTEAEWAVGNRWLVGYDTRLLETIKQDIMGVVGRTVM